MERLTTIVWFRGADLRMADNPALEAAIASGGPVIPVYVHDPEAAGEWGPGANARAWLGRSLRALDTDLREVDSQLVVRTGTAEQVLSGLVREAAASRVVFARRWEPWARAQEARVTTTCGAAAEITAVTANLLAEPGTILTGMGTPYRVFTPFYERWRDKFVVSSAPVDPASTPGRLAAPERWPVSEPIETVFDGSLAPDSRCARVLEDWRPGEEGALDRLAGFVGRALASYESDRDRPDVPGTSRLSPHLAYGEVSVARVVHIVHAAGAALGCEDQAESFVRQMAWREFAAHVLDAGPTLPELPVRPQFERFPWHEDPVLLDVWRRGETGFPMIDAGMNQLLASGWMHNRVRMLVASFLTKDLLIPWQQGERWFWDNLVDADLASNAFGWQWVAGCGHDASPYFRIFNPTAQGRRFDPDGSYVREWVPGSHDHRPIVDHGEARTRALAAYRSIQRR